MVSQLERAVLGHPVGGSVSTTGPPAVPSGSIQADIVISRFGSVGPSTEQW